MVARRADNRLRLIALTPICRLIIAEPIDNLLRTIEASAVALRIGIAKIHLI